MSDYLENSWAVLDSETERIVVTNPGARLAVFADFGEAEKFAKIRTRKALLVRVQVVPYD